MYQLRPYQNESVQAVINHFRRSKNPAVLVLPTGAGKSLVIAELARIARGRVLVLAHVKELVEQNHQKFESYDLQAGVFSAGLSRKEIDCKVTFGSIQSVARASEDFFKSFSILIVDECHRISDHKDTQYHSVIAKLSAINPDICILGLTATPYRLGLGWLYEYNTQGFLRSQEPRFFKRCVYELSLKYMIQNKYLTPPIKIDAPVACYDFSSLKLSGKQSYSRQDLEAILGDQKRVTPGIVGHIIKVAEERQGVMIFTSSVHHAKEILSLLPESQSAIVVGETESKKRNEIIEAFKERRLKFLVNVSVLTTGFDAPHVDLIALLRPTESISLFQQIVGRGLRLAEGKEDCLILDYTGQDYDLFDPEVGEKKPNEESVVVGVVCPECGFENQFWGIKDEFGEVMEHYGRKCQGAFEHPDSLEVEPCGYRFRFKICDACGAENDIAARVCCKCKEIIVDVDKRLKKAMELADAHVMRPDTMLFTRTVDKKKRPRLEVQYYDVDANVLKEYFYFESESQVRAFHYNFTKMHFKLPRKGFFIKNIDHAMEARDEFRMPMYVVARKKKYFWRIREKIF